MVDIDNHPEQVMVAVAETSSFEAKAKRQSSAAMEEESSCPEVIVPQHQEGSAD